MWVPRNLTTMGGSDTSFEVRGPGRLLFGRGRAARTGEHVGRFGERVLVVTDAGIREAGLLEPVLDSLRKADVAVETFEDVSADPTTSNAAAAAAAAETADVLVGIGGGSPMDVAKAAALAAGSGRAIDDLVTADGSLPPGKPTILVPTTAGTGSEVSPAAVLKDAETGDKRGLIDPSLFADVALVDPELSMTLPPHLTATTGIDAFAHAAGSYVSTESNEFSDALCLRAMALIESNLRDATFHGADRPAARRDMALAATMAMYGRVIGGKSAIHAVAYGVQTMYDLPHAEAIALVMPAVLSHAMPAALDSYARLGTQLYDATGSRGNRARAFVDGVRTLRDDLGLPDSLAAVGGSAEDLEELSMLCVDSERHLRASPRYLAPEDAQSILETLL